MVGFMDHGLHLDRRCKVCIARGVTVDLASKWIWNIQATKMNFFPTDLRLSHLVQVIVMILRPCPCTIGTERIAMLELN
jgi:hypothetical protein